MRVVLSLVAAIGLFAAGCSQAPEGTTEVTGASHDHEHISLCVGCGHAKGTDACCAEGAEKCTECSLAKGSPACCNDLIVDGKAKDLCGDCGHVAHGDNCNKYCAEGAEGGERCADCKWAKGSPACCKIKKPADEDTAETADTDEAAAS